MNYNTNNSNQPGDFKYLLESLYRILNPTQERMIVDKLDEILDTLSKYRSTHGNPEAETEVKRATSRMPEDIGNILRWMAGLNEKEQTWLYIDLQQKYPSFRRWLEENEG